MKKSFYFFAVIAVLFVACKKDKDGGDELQADVKTGLVADIGFTGGSTIDSVSMTVGINNNALPTANRRNISNSAMMFSAIDSSNINFGDLDNLSFPNNKFSISCWVKVGDTTVNNAILSKRGDTGPFEYSLDTHFGKNFFALDNWIPSGGNTVYGIDPLKARAPIQTNNWQHIVVVADGQSLKVYVNSVPQAGADNRNGGNSFENTTAPFVVGNGGNFGVNHFFNGSIDDIKIYNRVLSNNDVLYLYKH